MKLTTEIKRFDSNVSQEQSSDFGIGDATVVIEILRNRLYENKIQTLTQEYLCNGRDAGREVNSTRPIEVTFPSLDNLNMVIRDFGPGVSPDRMKNVFVLYGNSTKRDSNFQTGGFGLGSKSAWAYTESFTITTFIDGIHRVYVAHIGDNKNGRIDLMSEGVTTEENGTAISISVRRQDVSAFAEAIIRATTFWEESEYPVFKNAGIYKTNLDEQRKIGLIRFMGTNLSGIPRDKHKTGTWIVIDGIPYPYSGQPTLRLNELIRTVNSEKSTLNIFVPNGLVQVAASREKIDDSDISKKALEQIFIAAIADFKRARDEWDDTIVDSKSMLAAESVNAGFVLSSNKMFDFVTFKNGKYDLKLTRMFEIDNDGGNDIPECLFKVQNIVADKTKGYQKPFNVVGPNRYYMTKGGVRSIQTIRDWIACTANVAEVNLITIEAGRETEAITVVPITKQSTTYKVWSRNDQTALEMIEVVERLGFVNIETIIPKQESVKKDKKVRKYGSINQVNFHTDVDSVLKMDEIDALPQTEIWVYHVGAKSEYDYERFKKKAGRLKHFAQFDKAFRVLEKNEKLISDDPRFIKFEDFEKKWVPSTKMVLSCVARDICQNTDINIFKNILANITDHNEIVYKASKFIEQREAFHFDYETKAMVQNTAKYKEHKVKVEKMMEFTRKYFPLFSYAVKDNDHNKQYAKWALDNTKLDGVNLSKLDVL